MLANDRSVASPEAAGVDPAKFEALCARAARAVEEAGLPAAQLAVARNGRIAARQSRSNAFGMPGYFSWGTTAQNGAAGALAALSTVAADGPIGFLAGRKPLLTLAAKPFHLVFGRR